MKKIREEPFPNIIGIDYGETNIGLALGNNGLVSPLKIVQGKNINGALYEINRVIVENKIETIVVGIPLNAEGKDTKESLKVRRFAKILKATTKRPVIFQNEYGSSKMALEEALCLDIPQKKRSTNDHLAAALILRMYYNEESGRKKA